MARPFHRAIRLAVVGLGKPMNCYDPRKQDRIETENPALIAAEIAVLCGLQVNWGRVAENADYYDEMVYPSEANSYG